MKKFDWVFGLLVVLPIVLGATAVVKDATAYVAPWDFTGPPLGAGIALIVLGFVIWRMFAIRVQTDEWKVRFGPVFNEYFDDGWVMNLGHFGRVYHFDGRIREVTTPTTPTDPDMVRAQIFLSDEIIPTVKTTSTQAFGLVFQISYQLDTAKYRDVLTAYMDDIDETGSVDGAVRRVLTHRLGDLMNVLFQPESGLPLNIEDVAKRSEKFVDRFTTELNTKMQEMYATTVLSVLVNQDPIDLVVDPKLGYMHQRTLVIGVQGQAGQDLLNAQDRSTAAQGIATADADASVKQSEESQRAQVAGQEAEKAIVVKTSETEVERIKLRLLQGQASQQQRIAELEVYRMSGALEAELSRSFAEDDSASHMAGWVMLARMAGLTDLAKSIADFLQQHVPSKSE